METIKITDTEDKYFGKELVGCCIYYDYGHNGGTEYPIVDLFSATTPDGTSKRYLSTQIDVEHYEDQLFQKELIRLGAKVRDNVMIVREGSGSWGNGFDLNIPHEITKINKNGTVEFDNGDAKMFRPDVEIVKINQES